MTFEPCGDDQNPATAVTVTVTSLDRTTYALDEPITFEFRIENTGKEILKIPWTPNSADLDQAGPEAPYKYRRGDVSLILTDPEGRRAQLSEILYGSEDSPGTLRELLPGQWFTVRGRKRIEYQPPAWGQDELRDFVWVDAKASGSFAQYDGSFSPEGGASFTETCIPTTSKTANKVTVTFQPALSSAPGSDPDTLSSALKSGLH